MLNVQFFIVCQCNPHIVPFFYNSKGKVGRPSRWSSGTQEHSWRGGFLLAALEMYLKVCGATTVWRFTASTLKCIRSNLIVKTNPTSE